MQAHEVLLPTRTDQGQFELVHSLRFLVQPIHPADGSPSWALLVTGYGLLREGWCGCLGVVAEKNEGNSDGK